MREVDWAQSAALLVRREAAARIGWMDPAFFVYSDEVDFCKRLHDAGWKNLYVPQAEAIHHEQLSTGSVPKRRIVELSRNRERYMRKHHSLPVGADRALADGVDVRAAGDGGLRAAAPRPGALLAARQRDAPPRPRRGAARGGRRLQPRRSAPVSGRRCAAAAASGSRVAPSPPAAPAPAGGRSAAGSAAAAARRRPRRARAEPAIPLVGSSSSPSAAPPPTTSAIWTIRPHSKSTRKRLRRAASAGEASAGASVELA